MNVIENYILYQLLEAKQVGKLYHFIIDINNLNFVLRTNKLFSRWQDTFERIFNKKYKIKDYTSLTRNLQWAKYGGNIILVLDGNKISENYKIIPFFFLGNQANLLNPTNASDRSPVFYSPNVLNRNEFDLGKWKNKKNEFEERVKGQIKDIDKYLIKIIVKKSILNTNDPILEGNKKIFDQLVEDFPNIKFEIQEW